MCEIIGGGRVAKFTALAGIAKSLRGSAQDKGGGIWTGLLRCNKIDIPNSMVEKIQKPSTIIRYDGRTETTTMITTEGLCHVLYVAVPLP
jgi:hypothetical protein